MAFYGWGRTDLIPARGARLCDDLWVKNRAKGNLWNFETSWIAGLKIGPLAQPHARGEADEGKGYCYNSSQISGSSVDDIELARVGSPSDT